jgi:hypothetical protein
LAAARLAARQWSVLDVAELEACGLDKHAVSVRVRQGHLHPLYRGVYAWGHDNLTLEGRFLAAVKACGPEAALSNYAATALHQWLKYDGRPIDVMAPTKRTHPGINTHRSATIQRTKIKGIPVTTRVRTIIDLARTEDEPTVKRALRQAKFSAYELAQLPRRGKLGRILALSAAPTRSRNEDYVLDLILKSGLQHPEVNAPYRLPGRTVYPDLWWPALRLIVEVDSDEWHSDPLARIDDADRQSLLEAAGERVIRVTDEQAKRDPRRTLARLRAAGVPAA